MTHALRAALARLRALFRRDVVAGEIHEEMEFHLQMREEELRAQGLSAQEARRAAARRFGSLALMHDRGYDVRGGGVMETVVQDLRYALRLFARRPASSSVAIGTIALAMGIATALFSVIDAAILRPLPFRNPEQIVSAGVRVEFGSQGVVLYPSASIADMRRWEGSGVFSALAAWRDGIWGSIVNHPSPERVRLREVTEGYLALHEVAPILGRDFTAADTAVGAAPVVMLSHEYWQTRLGSDPRVIGRTFRYDDVAAIVVGVLPAGFYPDRTVWRPLQADVVRADRRGGGGEVYGRLRRGITIQDAERRLAAVTPIEPRRSENAAEPSPGGHVRLTSLLDRTIASYRRTVVILAAAVGLIVLIACVNVAGLLLASGAARQAELAVRGSLGATRGRLVRQLLMESVVLALAGGALGAFLAWSSLSALVAILPMTLPLGVAVDVNLRVLGACIGVATVTGIAFGLSPALRLSRGGAGSAAWGAARSAPLSRRGGQYLIAAEVALAVVLVVGAGLMVRSFARLISVDLGFDPDAVMAFKVAPAASDPAVHAAYYPDLLRAIETLPGVDAAGAVDHFALGGTGVHTMISIDGSPIGAGIRQVLPGYFDALGVPIRRGRLPSPADGASGASVAVVNESAASLFPGEALGSRFTLGRRAFEVIGVVPDIRHAVQGGPANRPEPEVFVFYQPSDAPAQLALGMTVVVRPHAGTGNLAGDLRRTAESIGPRVVVEDVRSGNEWLSDRVATPRHRTALLTLLGASGLFLALVGVFSTTASAVARRTREIGVRMALGARPVALVGHLVRDAGWPVFTGIVLGLSVAYYATRAVQSFLFEITPHDAATFAAVALLMIAAGLVAAWIPARRAAYVDPVATLRSE